MSDKETCTWKKVGVWYEDDYETGCGKEYNVYKGFDDGFTYCPFCGKVIQRDTTGGNP